MGHCNQCLGVKGLKGSGCSQRFRDVGDKESKEKQKGKTGFSKSDHVNMYIVLTTFTTFLRCWFGILGRVGAKSLCATDNCV